MFINQANQIDKYTNHINEFSKTSASELEKGQGVFAFEKAKETYRMTEQGSFFMPDATYQKPDGKEEEQTAEHTSHCGKLNILCQLDSYVGGCCCEKHRDDDLLPVDTLKALYNVCNVAHRGCCKREDGCHVVIEEVRCYGHKHDGIAEARCRLDKCAEK